MFLQKSSELLIITTVIALAALERLLNGLDHNSANSRGVRNFRLIIIAALLAVAGLSLIDYLRIVGVMQRQSHSSSHPIDFNAVWYYCAALVFGVCAIVIENWPCAPNALPPSDAGGTSSP